MAPWSVPSNLQALVAADPDQIWETKQFAPITLTVMGGTAVDGRPIPLSWQLDFEPTDIASARVEKLIEEMGNEPDGYGWAELIEQVIARDFPELLDEVRSDSEIATCVIDVEDEETCRRVYEIVVALVEGGQGA